MNIAQMMKQAQQLSAKMESLKEQLASYETSGAAGGGKVTCVMNGKGELKSIKLDKSVVTAEDVELLEDLIVAAVADAKQKVEAHAAEEGQKALGGAGKLPFGMKMPF